MLLQKANKSNNRDYYTDVAVTQDSLVYTGMCQCSRLGF